jgi:hypothetical protein
MASNHFGLSSETRGEMSGKTQWRRVRVIGQHLYVRFVQVIRRNSRASIRQLDFDV